MLPLIPFPNDIKQLDNTVCFSNYKIEADEKFKKSLFKFENELNEKLNKNENDTCYTFKFVQNPKLNKEHYVVNFNENECVVFAKSQVGCFYATRTLAQLLKLNTANKLDSLCAPSVFIEDRPRFKHRSFMVDEVRHFFGIDEIKKIIDLMSDLKFNYFHWHLSDDQGFRINFKEFKALKDIASKRSKTKINSIEGEDYDNTPYEYCYEVKQIKEIIKYAKERFIEIIPEIDIPGHTTAIVAAYPELHCFNRQNEVGTGFGVFYDIMCPGKEQTYIFCKKLLKELCLLFKDSKYIHIGGDEVNPKNWNECPDCTKKAKELNLDNNLLLQAHFMNEMTSYLHSLNKKVITWHDGVYANTDPKTIMQYWTWEMHKPSIEQINNGRTTIYSPCSQFYFNDPYAELPLKTTYCKKITLDGLTRKGLSNIFAIEGCIWTEWVDSNELLEVLIIPRVQALAEKAWTKNKNLNFKDFLNRLEAHHEYLDYKNFAYASNKLALAQGKKYREKVAKSFRGNDKKVEFKLYLKQKNKQ